MSRNTNTNRAAMIRKASAFPAGSPERKAILANLESQTSGRGKESSATQPGTLGMLYSNTMVLRVGNRTIQIVVPREQLSALAAGEILDVKVDLGPNDEIPMYVQTQLRETQDHITSALSMLSNVTKKF